jgi:putative molybdopterin biosynthesis protein
MNDIPTALRNLARQEQFLEVVGSAEATARFHPHLKLCPLGSEIVPLSQALSRVLAHSVHANVDVPGFDRANVDGFAVRAADTAGASTRAPKVLALNGEVLTPGNAPEVAVTAGTATLIATGGMVPRGADAVVMVEHTETCEAAGGPAIEIRRAVAAGQFIPAQDEHYDFAVPKSRIERPAARRFRAMLAEPEVCEALAALGFRL